MKLFTKQKQIHRHKNKCMVTKGKRGGRDKLGDQQIQTTIYKIDNKVLVYNTGNYIQYLVINYNGKESEKNIYIYIYIYV